MIKCHIRQWHIIGILVLLFLILFCPQLKPRWWSGKIGKRQNDWFCSRVAGWGGQIWKGKLKTYFCLLVTKNSWKHFLNSVYEEKSAGGRIRQIFSKLLRLLHFSTQYEPHARWFFNKYGRCNFLDIWLMTMMNNQKKLVRSAHHNIFYSIAKVLQHVWWKDHLRVVYGDKYFFLFLLNVILKTWIRKEKNTCD